MTTEEGGEAVGVATTGGAVAAVPMQILGQLEAFDPTTDTVSSYVE